MSRTEASIEEFLAQRAVAVVGVSRKETAVANAIYRKLDAAGYRVFAVNPAMDEFDGRRCYHGLGEIGEPVDGVVVVTRPAVTEAVVDECVALGIPRVWMHGMLGTRVRVGRGLSARIASASEAAVAKARAAGMTVIPGDCPMQHVAPVDGWHRCVHWAAGALGNRE